MKRKELTKTIMMISNWSLGLYKKQPFKVQNIQLFEVGRDMLSQLQLGDFFLLNLKIFQNKMMITFIGCYWFN